MYYLINYILFKYYILLLLHEGSNVSLNISVRNM